MGTRTALRSLAVAAALLGAAAAAPGARAGERSSLEELLHRARSEAGDERARLADPVAAWLDELDVVAARPPDPDRAPELARVLERHRAALVELGPEAAPLVVGAIDPGDGADAAARFRARQVAAALAGIDRAGIAPELLRLAREGSVAGARNALALLPGAGDADPLADGLCALWPPARAELRVDLLTALLESEHPRARSLVDGLLAEGVPDEVAQVLGAYGRVGGERALAAVRELLADPSTGGPHLLTALELYRRVPESFEDEDAERVVAILSRPYVAREDRIAALALLPELATSRRPSWRHDLEDLAERTTGELSLAARICAARLGSREARRVALAPHDEAVRENPDLASNWTRRGDLLMALGDYGGALRDYREALEADMTWSRRRSTLIAVARCYCREDRLGRAADALEEAALSDDEKRGLAADPDFAALAADERHGAVLATD